MTGFQRYRSAALALVLAVAAVGTAVADEKTSKNCARAFDACLKECDAKFGVDTAKRAACVPGCSAKYAACDAGVAYEEVKPWLEEQLEKSKKIIDDFMKDLKKDKPEPPAPTTQSIKTSY